MLPQEMCGDDPPGFVEIACGPHLPQLNDGIYFALRRLHKISQLDFRYLHVFRQSFHKFVVFSNKTGERSHEIFDDVFRFAGFR